ncbi:ESX secretion system protein EccC [Mycolicibacterium vanbaalenii]|uniref:ESX secretion system protein EccC n=1 Tax=Mycolicibacterium vanbaalenii TaxID=110539 RepID=A0A5S9R4M6_MYCVN|nr:type VII secretion protein EccCa [Mycolicibacterium vanbaalenii]CAA0129372.1 ESX secretion system protein EccC [Mycolicibacterium vanbaalenii]
MPGGQIVLDAPPELPNPTPVSPMARLMPVVMLAAMAGMSVLYLTSGHSAARNPMFLFFPAMMLVSVIGTLAYSARGTGRITEINVQRAQYLRYLVTLDDTLADCAQHQHLTLYRIHPDPGALWTLAGTERMWERTPEHPQFGSVRVGVGEQPSATTVVAPELDSDDSADPVTTGAARRLVSRRATVGGVPVTVQLRSTAVVAVAGPAAHARAVVRALVCQVAVLHHPCLIGIAVMSGPGARAAWDWLKWLPHHSATATGRHRVVVVDGCEAPAPADGLTVVEIDADDGGAAVAMTADADGLAVACDVLSLPDALACARRLARHLPSTATAHHQRGAADWLGLLGIDDAERIDADRMWSAARGQPPLRVPIGTAEDGTVVELDIREAAAGGVGPHGLCVGATGSGKSEFLRTLTLGMIATHSPEVLNLVLVDFKGGATFLGMEQARHVSAVITNLADEAPLVSRMREALSGEVHRRQEILRAAGNLANISEYDNARARNRGLPALPALFVVVDEFSELLSQHPDFAELFVAIGRLGRSLGMHLLLASQRLDEGRLRGLETHLSYRVCLKTFSASESRAVLGVADAYHLPSQPGAAYLKTASGAVTRFQAAFVSGGYTPRRPPGGTVDRPAAVLFTPSTAAPPRHPATPADTALPQRSVLDTVLCGLAGQGPAAHQVWLPPLGRSPRLGELLQCAPAAHLRVPIGLVDRPYEQRHEQLVVDLSGAAGNVAVVGAPRSGKSTTLRTVLSALAATHDAGDVQFYCLDFGGGALAALAGLPHVGSVAGRREPDRCRRTVAALEAVLRRREAAFQRLGVDSYAEYRRTRESADDPYGEVFLVIDGWAVVRQEFDALEAPVTALAAQGLSYGLHVMIAAGRWADLRPALKDQIATRIELRLGDPAESEMDRRRARELAERAPGRGITREGREFAIALPHLDPVGCRAGGAAPPVELLPTLVEHRSLVGAAAPHRALEVLLGVGERDLAPVLLDFAEHPHLLVLGEGECGKTAVLRLLCTELVRTRTPSQMQLEIVDFRRTLLGVIESEHLRGYSVSSTALTSRMTALTDQLTERMPDEHVTQQQLRDRSWWAGPEIYVVVDDYDLVAGATGNPLTPLADFLPHAKDLGLHVVVARRSGGAARAMFDPVLARLRDMGCSGLMMSAAPDEGVLLGTSRPGPLPPGRGTVTARGRPEELLQVGWVPPP